MSAPTGERGVTLLELMVSITLALALTTMAMVAFFSIRKLVSRAESKLAMHASTQTIYHALHKTMAGLQQTCAFVVYSKANTEVDTSKPPNDEISIVFMRGKEDTQDFQYFTESYAGQSYKATMNSDLLWESWTWKDETYTKSDGTVVSGGTLYSATNSPVRQFSLPWGTSISGQAYNGQKFDLLPQPRRTLDTTDMTSWQKTLNDNQYFPDMTAGSKDLFDPTLATVYNRKSLYSASDIGDWEELVYKRSPALTQVSAFSMQVIPHDGSAAGTVLVQGSRSTTPNQTKIYPGVWLDGRLAATLSSAQTFSSSDAAKRPKLLRFCFTLTDTSLKFSQSFSFSFLLPGLAPPL